jgi:hypothetical protein
MRNCTNCICTAKSQSYYFLNYFTTYVKKINRPDFTFSPVWICIMKKQNYKCMPKLFLNSVNSPFCDSTTLNIVQNLYDTLQGNKRCVRKICIIDSENEKVITFTSKGLFATVNSFVVLQNAKSLKSI